MLLAQTWLNIKAQSHCVLIFSCDITSIQMMSCLELKPLLCLLWASFFKVRCIFPAAKVLAGALTELCFYQRISVMIMFLLSISILHIFLTVWPYLQGVWYGRRGTWHHSSKSSRIKGETLSQYPPDILWQWKLTVVIHEFSILKGENVHNFIIILEQHTSICVSFSYLT